MSNKVTRSINRSTGKTEIRGNVSPQLQKLMNSTPLGQLRHGIYGGTVRIPATSTAAPVRDPETQALLDQIAAHLETDPTRQRKK